MLESSQWTTHILRILAWNICQGGENHSALAAGIVAHTPDIIVLSEHQTDKSRPLVEQLQQSGWTHVAASPTDGRRNGVAVLSKQPLVTGVAPFGAAPFAWWGIEARIDNVSIIGVYAPLATSWGSSPQIQRHFWDAVHRLTEGRRAERVVLIGDFNTCARGVDGPNPQPCWDAFEQLPAFGWADAWRAVNPGANDHSWVNRGASPPTHYRLDHAFVSPLLAGAVKTCRYSHAEREAGLSDHSMLVLDLELVSRTD